MSKEEVIEIGSRGNVQGIRTSRAVCRRCGLIMRDLEECSSTGEFYHHRWEKPCVNDYKTLKFSKPGADHGEILPFQDKRTRRALTRGAKLTSKYRG